MMNPTSNTAGDIVKIKSLLLPFALIACFAGMQAEASTGGPSANPIDPSIDIEGGQIAPRQDWAVFVTAPDGNCTGIALTEHYILTAKHCLQDKNKNTLAPEDMSVQYSTDDNNHPDETKLGVAELYLAPAGDVALLQLREAHPIQSYPELNLNYYPFDDDPVPNGYIYGYGSHGQATAEDPTALYVASVSILGKDERDGDDTIVVHAGDGSPKGGDSGGPLFVKGRIVGICRSADDFEDLFHGAHYSNLRQVREWFRSIFPPAVTYPQNGGTYISGIDLIQGEESQSLPAMNWTMPAAFRDSKWAR